MKKVTYEGLIEKKPQGYIVEQLSDRELVAMHHICKTKPDSEKTEFEKSRVREYLPLLEFEITKRQEEIRKSKESVNKKHKEDEENDEFQDLEDEGVVSDEDEDNKGDEIEKGKRGQIGEIRTHGGKKVQKQQDGSWKPVKGEEKKGNSRGGKVIGHTKSGKPIYTKHEQEHTQHYTHEDHSDAMSAHMKMAQVHSDRERRKGNFYLESGQDRDKLSAQKSGQKSQHHSSMAALHQSAMNQKLDKKDDESELENKEKEDSIDYKSLRTMNRKDFEKLLSNYNFNSADVKDKVDMSKLQFIRTKGVGMNMDSYFTDGSYIYRDPSGSSENPSQLQRFS